MKTVNQFDYPTAQATTFKAYKQTPVQNPKQQQMHYQKVIRQESQQERDRVKAKEGHKKRVQSVQQLSRIKQDIEKKKRQVRELQLRMQQAVQSQRKAAEMAKLKEEQDRIKKYEDEQRAQEQDENAQFRFKDALRRLQAERQENAVQERQAQMRRKTNQQAEKVERGQAIRFKEWQKVKEDEEARREREEQSKQFQLMRSGLGRMGFSKPGTNYSKTCHHNPHMVFRGVQEGQSALQRGQSQERQRKEQQAAKIQRSEEHRRRSQERGTTALQRLQDKKEYSSFEREAERQQIDYNLQRIEEGKRNQFIGIKPLTLGQIESNKKIRGQQEFEDMFLTPQVATYEQPASKYLIIERQHPTAQAAQVSGQFSSHFNDSYSRGYSGMRQEQPAEEEAEEAVIEERSKPMAQTRAEGAHREELYYSESEEDSSYA